MKTRFLRAAICSATLLLAEVANSSSIAEAGLMYDARIDFAINTTIPNPNNPNPQIGNPNGVWSYGYTETPSNSLVAYGSNPSNTVLFVHGGLGVGGPFWALNQGVSHSTIIWRNDHWIGANGVPANSGGINDVNSWLVMHPGDDKHTILRFTAPISTNYEISLEYLAGDSYANQGRVDVQLFKNRTVSLYAAQDTWTGGSALLPNNHLLAGDTIDLVIGRGMDQHSYDSTPVRLVITAVPEPSAGLSVLLASGATLWRRKRFNSTSRANKELPTFRP